MINFFWGIISFLQSYNGAVTAVATVFIAAFTIVLTLVTNHQAKLTKIAAYAAKNQADAAIGIELPIFTLRSRLMFQRSDEICQLCFVNQGRTYAIITKTCAAFAVTASLPVKPRYPLESIQDTSFFIEAKDGFTIDRSNSVSAEDWRRALNGETIIWIFGYFEYADFLKTTHIERFCFGSEPIDPTAWKARFGLPIGDETPHSVSWIAKGPPAYIRNDYKEET